MKKPYPVFFLLLTISALSQSEQSLKATTKKLYQANYLLDFNGIAFLSYPKMVEIIGTDNMQDKLEKHYENDTYRLRQQLESVPFQYGQIKKFEGKSFCVISCRNPLRYTFEERLNTGTAAAKTSWLKEINKTNDVTFEPSRNSFNVKKTTTFVAVADENTRGEWRFFNFDDAGQYEYFVTLFGESTKKELGL